MRYQQAARQAVRQRMGAKLIAAGAILEMSGSELQQRIHEELSANPALELSDEQLCPVCNSPLRGGRCRSCTYVQHALEALAGEVRAPYSAEPDDDPFARMEVPVSLQDHLRLQARLALPRGDYPLAAYLIANVDDRGLLTSDLSELAAEVQLSLEELQRVQTMLQTLDPTGVCSSTPQQAVLAQLHLLTQEQPVHPLAQTIISQHWHSLANHAYCKIARALHTTVEQVEEALAFIRANLNPYPGSQFRVSWEHDPANPQALARPDVIIHRNLDEYMVEVMESQEYVLRVSETYRELQRTARMQSWPAQEWREALDCLHQAEWFIHSIRMRRRTLKEVTECIIELQRPCLDTGLEERLRPLTRVQVAAELGKHESTVSRAITGKLVLLPAPSNRIVPLDHFFIPALGIKSQIEHLIQRESPERPLTDQQICQILATRGHRVARRTVAKYRLALRIPSSEQRGHR